MFAPIRPQARMSRAWWTCSMWVVALSSQFSVHPANWFILPHCCLHQAIHSKKLYSSTSANYHTIRELSPEKLGSGVTDITRVRQHHSTVGWSQRCTVGDSRRTFRSGHVSCFLSWWHTRSDDKTIRLWDKASGAHLKLLKDVQTGSSQSFSPQMAHALHRDIMTTPFVCGILSAVHIWKLS